MAVSCFTLGQRQTGGIVRVIQALRHGQVLQYFRKILCLVHWRVQLSKGTTVPGILRRSSELLCRLRTVGGVGLRRSSPWLVATAINTTLATTVVVWGSTNNEVSNHHGTGE